MNYSALLHSTKFCCDSLEHSGSAMFDLQDFLPGAIFVEPPPDDATDTSCLKWKNLPKSTAQWKINPCLIFIWFNFLSVKMLLVCFVPSDHHISSYLILSAWNSFMQTQRKSSPQKMYNTFLKRAIKWRLKWAEKLYTVITDYERDLATIKRQSKKHSVTVPHAKRLKN